MKKHHVVATIGTLALMANFLVPGLAFGESTQQQTGQIHIDCPTPGDFTFNHSPADVTFVTKQSSATETQSSIDSAITSDTELPAANVLAISDLRSVNVDGCPEAQAGFTVSVTGTDLTHEAPLTNNTIDGSTIHLITTGHYVGAPIYGATNAKFSADNGTGNHLPGSTVTPYNLESGFDTADNYAGSAALMDGGAYTILQRTGPTNSVVSVATALAIVQGIMPNQYPGTYSGIITYSLNPS